MENREKGEAERRVQTPRGREGKAAGDVAPQEVITYKPDMRYTVNTRFSTYRSRMALKIHRPGQRRGGYKRQGVRDPRLPPGALRCMGMGGPADIPAQLKIKMPAPSLLSITCPEKARHV